jgi:hypothetical protein
MEQSPTGGHERAPELEQVPDAVVKGKSESERERAVRTNPIVGNHLDKEQYIFTGMRDRCVE